MLEIVAAPNRLSVVLVGLCLAACTSTSEAPSKPNTAPAAPSPAADPVEGPKPTTAIPPEPPQLEPAPSEAETTGETGDAEGRTTADEVPEVEASEGTTDGSTTTTTTKTKQPKPDPRPAKTYGGPPKPDLEPLGD